MRTIDNVPLVKTQSDGMHSAANVVIYSSPIVSAVFLVKLQRENLRHFSSLSSN